MTLADFIERNMEPLLREWECFAREAQPARANLYRKELRDWAKSLLEAMAAEMKAEQSDFEQESKSKGRRGDCAPALTEAAQGHAIDRLAQGFDIDQMVSEYRALRATVVRLWIRESAAHKGTLLQLVRFNEALDQALTESIRRYSAVLERARDLFVGALGHDMRAPLSSILASAEALLLSSDDLESRHLQGAVRIRNAGKRISRMLHDLLDFTCTRLGGPLPMSREPADLAPVCTAIVEEVRALHPDRDIQLECDSDLDGRFDVNRVGQLLSNLALNALKHGYEDSPVRITAHKTHEAVYVRVYNEGEPIPEDLRRSMFEPLVRGRLREQVAAREQQGGLGLGLFIAREIALGHDGAINFDSTAGGGTTFEARLSRAPSESNET